MTTQYQAPDLASYRMSYHDPHRALEPLYREIEIVEAALDTLVKAGLLPHKDYDHDKMIAHRRAVAELFDIPWTAVTPRAQRLLYAINAIARPQVMIAAGIFCGNTFIANAGAAVGPGAVYSARDLVGLEILQEEAERAARNVRLIDPTGTARIVAAEAVEFVRSYKGEIDLLYLDPDGPGTSGQGLYFDVLQAAYDKLPQGALILAHNSHNAATTHKQYLDFVRNPANFRASAHLILDVEGLEISQK